MFEFSCSSIPIYICSDGSNPSGGGGGGDPSKWSGAIKKRGLQGAFIHFCREIPVSPAALLEKGFRYRNFSKSTINQLKMKIELEVKSNNLIGPASSNQASLKHRHSADNFNLEADGPRGVKAISDNLTYKEVRIQAVAGRIFKNTSTVTSHINETHNSVIKGSYGPFLCTYLLSFVFTLV